MNVAGGRPQPSDRLPRAFALVLSMGAVSASFGACRSCDDAGPAGAPDAGPTPLVVKKNPSPPPDAVAAIAARTPGRPGSCAQVRSLRSEAEAEAVAEAIRTRAALPVEVVRADLGDRGTWWRICVGAEETEARLVARATRWTSPGGELEPFLDEVRGAATDAAPRFFVLSRDSVEGRKALPGQAAGLLSHVLAEGAPIVFFGGPSKETLTIAGTGIVEGGGVRGGGTDVVAVDPTGRRLGFDETAAPGCATCALALKEGSVRARRAITAGDAAPIAGEELLVEEDTDKGVRLLSVLTVSGPPGGSALRRVASLVLENARAGFVQTGRAGLVEGDTDPEKEIVLAATELRVQGDFACALEQHAAIYDLPAEGNGLVRIDPLAGAPSTDPPDAVINVIAALDAWGDHDSASRACAAHLARSPQASTTQLCLQRVRRLMDGGHLVDAVNAAGLLSESSPTLRPLLASSFHDAADALDRDPRLFAGELDCARSPLVDRLSQRSLDETMQLARARAGERVALSDVNDAVFVTGARDFGAESPVGAITAKWLERARVALPARYAAIEALLLPQAQPEEEPKPSAAFAAEPGSSVDAGPPVEPAFGGAP